MHEESPGTPNSAGDNRFDQPSPPQAPQQPAGQPQTPPAPATAASQGPPQPPQPRSDDRISAAPLELRPEDIRAGEGAKFWATRDDPQTPAPAEVKAGREEPPAAEGGPQTRAAIKAIEAALRDPNCTQIDGYGPGQITVQYNGRHQLLEGVSFSSPGEYESWLKSLVQQSSSVITWEDIKRERKAVLELPGGERLTIMLQPVSRPHATFSLRKHTAVDWPSQKLVELGSFTQEMHDFVAAAVAAHVNILFVGPMGSGKTSAMRAFLQSAAADEERIAVVEQVPELSIGKPLALHQQYLPTTEHFKLSDVLDYDLYFGLDRLIVGETHMEGLSKMLETMILTEGSMSTYHAYSTEQAGERMKLALQLEHENLSAETAASFIRQAVEMVVVLQKWGDRRLCTQITEIDWRTSSQETKLGGNNLFEWDQERGRHVPRNPPDRQGRIREKFLKYGLKLDENAFIDREQLSRFSGTGV